METLGLMILLFCLLGLLMLTVAGVNCREHLDGQPWTDDGDKERKQILTEAAGMPKGGETESKSAPSPDQPLSFAA